MTATAKTRNVQTPGEPALQSGADAGDLGAAGSGDKVLTGDNGGEQVDVDALRAQLAALQVENAKLKAKPAAAAKPAGAKAEVGDRAAGGHELTPAGWIVREPAPQPVKG